MDKMCLLLKVLIMEDNKIIQTSLMVCDLKTSWKHLKTLES